MSRGFENIFFKEKGQVGSGPFHIHPLQRYALGGPVLTHYLPLGAVVRVRDEVSPGHLPLTGHSRDAADAWGV